MVRYDEDGKRSARGARIRRVIGAGVILWLASACGSDRSDKIGQAVINEVACHGRDWIEVVNSSGAVLDLGGWFVADSLTQAEHHYALPDGTALQIGEHLVIRKQDELEDGFPFGLRCGQEKVYLLDGGKGIVDQVALGTVSASATWGRLPDFEGLWRETCPTPGDDNQAPEVCSQ